MTLETWLAISVGAGIAGLVAAAGKRSPGNTLALIIGIFIGGTIVSDMLAYTNEKHRHEREPMIARAWR